MPLKHDGNPRCRQRRPRDVPRQEHHEYDLARTEQVKAERPTLNDPVVDRLLTTAFSSPISCLVDEWHESCLVSKELRVETTLEVPSWGVSQK